MSAKLRVMLVDDEAPARARLRRLLLAHPQVEVVAEARNGREALQGNAEHRPDALFLDVQMPEADGLTVAASLPDPVPALVFVTAHDRYALPAFDAAALDYLLKPVDADHVARAVQRLLARAGPAANARRLPPEKLLISERGRLLVLPVAEIEWLEAADNYVVLHSGATAPLLRRTLTGLLADLGDTFVRTQRGAAVALGHVVAVKSLAKGDALLSLRGGAQVPCSRQFRAALAQRLAARRGG